MCPQITAKQTHTKHNYIYTYTLNMLKCIISSIIQCEFQTVHNGTSNSRSCLFSRRKKTLKLQSSGFGSKHLSDELYECVCFSLRAAVRHTRVWRIWKHTCAHTPERNPMCVTTRAATRPSPTPRTEPNTRTAHTPMR